MQGARLSFEAKVREAYPQVPTTDYPACPRVTFDQIPESGTEEHIAPKLTSEWPRTDETNGAGVAALIFELESALGFGEVTEVESVEDKPQDEFENQVEETHEPVEVQHVEVQHVEVQHIEITEDAATAPEETEVAATKGLERSWLHHDGLGELLSQIDDQSALLRDAAHQLAVTLHSGFDVEKADLCRRNWRQSQQELEVLWQEMEVFAGPLADGERIELPRDSQLDEELRRLLVLLQKYDEARRLTCNHCQGDLRELMRNLSYRVNEECEQTLESWLDGWLQADVEDAAGLLRDLVAFRNELESVCERSLEDELAALLEERLPKSERAGQEETIARRNEIFRQRMGWNGETARTLESLAAQWAVSRERIRQIIKPLEEWLNEAHLFTPVLGRALRTIRQQMPVSGEDLASQLQNENITDDLWSLEALCDTARSLGREVGFVLDTVEVEGDKPFIVVWNGETSGGSKVSAQRLFQLVATHVWERGIGFWPDLQLEIANAENEEVSLLAEVILEHHPAVRWIDRSQGWFWLEETRVLRGQESRLLTPIVRALSVARRLSLKRLYTAVMRVHLRKVRPGFDWEMPPQEVFEAWCYGQNRFSIENGQIEMRDTPPWREVVENTEATMVEIMEQHGPLLSRYKFYQLAAQRGIPKPTFYIYVDGLSTIEEIDDSVFALIGATITPQQLDEFHADYSNLHKRFQLRYGRLDNKQLWISYRISQGVINNGSLNIPKAMRGEFEGRYAITNSLGAPIGTLSFSAAQCWGLRTYFASHVSVGDRVTVIIHESHRQATVFIGLDELPHQIVDEVKRLEADERGEEDEEDE